MRGEKVSAGSRKVGSRKELFPRRLRQRSRTTHLRREPHDRLRNWLTSIKSNCSRGWKFSQSASADPALPASQSSRSSTLSVRPGRIQSRCPPGCAVDHSETPRESPSLPAAPTRPLRETCHAPCGPARPHASISPMSSTSSAQASPTVTPRVRLCSSSSPASWRGSARAVDVSSRVLRRLRGRSRCASRRERLRNVLGVDGRERRRREGERWS